MENKEFFTSDGKISAEVSFVDPTVAQTVVRGNADEVSSSRYAGYITHLFESGGLEGMIVDATQAGSVSVQAIDILAKSDALDFVKKVGVFGISNPVFRLALQAIIKGSGRDNIQIFATRDEALAYIKSGN